jgi:hypothetical protein
VTAHGTEKMFDWAWVVGLLGRPTRPPHAEIPVGIDYNDTRGAWLTMNRAMTENPPGVPASMSLPMTRASRGIRRK